MRALAETAGAWCLFIGGSLFLQFVDFALRDASVARGEKLLHATVRLPEVVFLGAHAVLALLAITIAFKATGPVPWLPLRVLLVAVQLAVGFVAFAVMMIGYSCGLGDCL